MTGGGWKLGQCRSFYSGATWRRAVRPHPEQPGQEEEIVARTVGELQAALDVHDRLDMLRTKYGADWVVGAEAVTDGPPRWVWAQRRAAGEPAPVTFGTPGEMEAFLAEG